MPRSCVASPRGSSPNTKGLRVLAELLKRLHADRQKNLRTLVETLARNGPLRPSKTEAVETVWALTSPELHQLLARVQGWTRRRFTTWLNASLASLAQLLLPLTADVEASAASL